MVCEFLYCFDREINLNNRLQDATQYRSRY